MGESFLRSVHGVTALKKKEEEEKGKQFVENRPENPIGVCVLIWL